jgi:hypothetical protein
LFKSPVNPITNPNPVYSHLTRDYMNLQVAKELFGKVTEFRYWRTAVANQNYIHEQVKNTLDPGNPYFHLIHNPLCSHGPSKNVQVLQKI